MNKKRGQIKRGDSTAHKMLEMGVSAFTQFGPDGISTRELAKKAKVNISAIGYYFGGKENYYCEVVRHLIANNARPVLLAFDQAKEDLNKSGKGKEAASDILRKLITIIIEAVILNPETRAVASIFSREQLHPTKASAIIYKEAIVKVKSTFEDLITAATETKPGAAETIVYAHFLAGQMLIFNLGADTLCKSLGLQKMEKKDAAFIAKTVSDVIYKIISSDKTPRVERSMK